MTEFLALTANIINAVNELTAKRNKHNLNTTADIVLIKKIIIQKVDAGICSRTNYVIHMTIFALQCN